MSFDDFTNGFTKAFNLFPGRLKDFNISVPEATDEEVILSGWEAVELDFKVATGSILGESFEPSGKR